MDSSFVGDSDQHEGFGDFALELELPPYKEVKKAAFDEKKKPSASEAKKPSDGKPYNHECKVCEKKFPYKSTLEQHSAVHQKDNRPFNCYISGCKKSYKLRNMLNRHLRSHSNVKDYKCFKCGKAFSWKHVLKRHLITHKDPSILFPCDVCERAFIDAEDLHQHKYTKHLKISM